MMIINIVMKNMNIFIILIHQQFVLKMNMLITIMKMKMEERFYQITVMIINMKCLQHQYNALINVQENMPYQYLVIFVMILVHLKY